MTQPPGDAFGPELAKAAPAALAAKATIGWGAMALLAIAAGAFIAFGSIGFLVAQGVAAASGPVQILSGVAFSVGLLLVMVTGAELFTGNTMFVLPVATGALGAGRMLGAWGVVWIGNLMGALLVAALFVAAHGGDGADGAVGRAAVEIAAAKAGKAPGVLFASAILANILVCLAVWMAMGATGLAGKALAIVGPVAVFVAAGFEHSVANMSILPIGAMLGDVAAGGIVRNLAISTAGNILGGAAVALLLGRAHRAAGEA